MMIKNKNNIIRKFFDRFCDVMEELPFNINSKNLNKFEIIRAILGILICFCGVAFLGWR